MKAHELIALLSKHPDWDVAFADFHYGGIERLVEPEDIYDGETDSNKPAKSTFIISTPYQGPDPE